MAQLFNNLYAIPMLLALATPGAALAVPIFTNFGTGQTYDTSHGFTVGGDFNGNENLAQASAFTPTQDANLGSILIALGDVFGQNDPVTVALASDSSGLPGSVLETFIVAGNALGSFGVNNAPLTLVSALNPLLSAGTQYWVTVSTSLSNLIAWNYNDGGDVAEDLQAVSLDGGATWDGPSGLFRAVFEVDPQASPPSPPSQPPTSSVPEPGVLALLVSGACLGMAGTWARRRGALAC